MKRLLLVNDYSYGYDKPSVTQIVIENICTINHYYNHSNDRFYYEIRFGANHVVTVDEDTYKLIEQYFTNV